MKSSPYMYILYPQHSVVYDIIGTNTKVYIVGIAPNRIEKQPDDFRPFSPIRYDRMSRCI